MALIWFASCRSKPGLLRHARFQEFAASIGVRPGRKQQYQRLIAVIKEYQQSELFWQRMESDDVDSCIRDILQSYYDHKNCKFWGDKYPEYLFYLNEIENILPDAKFLFLVRHPYHVARSLYVSRSKELKLVDLNEPRRSIADCVNQWLVWNAYLKNFIDKDSSNKHLLLSYESMLVDNDSVIPRISDFLGYDLASSPAVVEGFKQTKNTARDKSDPYYSLITESYSQELLELAKYFDYDPYEIAL